MSHPGLIEVVARVRLLSADEGGRSSSLLKSASYRPNHNFFGPGNREMAIGEVKLATVSEARPGDTVEVLVAFWPWERLEGELYPGREWLIQEGERVVATGVIERLV